MKINLLSLSDGAKTAQGIVVIIDVFRAYTTQSFAFEKGVLYCPPLIKGTPVFGWKIEKTIPEWYE